MYTCHSYQASIINVMNETFIVHMISQLNAIAIGQTQYIATQNSTVRCSIDLVSLNTKLTATSYHITARRGFTNTLQTYTVHRMVYLASAHANKKKKKARNTNYSAIILNYYYVDCCSCFDCAPPERSK